LKIHGYRPDLDTVDSLWVYGTDAEGIRVLAKNDPSLAEQLHSELPYIRAEVVWGVREEMARTLDDILSRRIRALFLNARAAIEMAPTVARLMAVELGRGEEWIQDQIATFTKLAEQYLLH
jgi:glycerol-3-phosphate dehydrogenase